MGHPVILNFWTDRNYDDLPVGIGLSRSELPPGWRPAAQTRASPPHQAKNGLDGDPGVWAYVCMKAEPFHATDLSELLSSLVFRKSPP